MNLTKNGKVFRNKFVETGLSSYKKRIYRAAVSQRLRNTVLNHSTRVTASILLYSSILFIIDQVSTT